MIRRIFWFRVPTNGFRHVGRSDRECYPDNARAKGEFLSHTILRRNLRAPSAFFRLRGKRISLRSVTRGKRLLVLAGSARDRG
jgi:hypothetical protein